MKCSGCGGVKLVKTKTSELKIPVPKPTQEQLLLALQAREEKALKMQQESKSDTKPEGFNIEEPEYPVSFQQCIEPLLQFSGLEVNCSVCNKNSTFISRHYFKTTPKYLMVPVERFTLQNWVPKKLNALIDIPNELDLKDFVFPGLEQDEKVIEENSSDEPQIDKQSLKMLMEMGYGENRASHALIEQKGNVEAAMNWIFEHMDDASYDQPIKKKNTGEPQFNQQVVAQLMEMGFGENKVKRALMENNQNSEQALNWLFSCGDDPSLDAPLPSANKSQSKFKQSDIDTILQFGFSENMAKNALAKTNGNLEQATEQILSGQVEDVPYVEEDKMQIEDEQEEDEKIISTKYQLHASVIHLGKSTGAGHYVCYVKRNNKWVIYNDAKVAETPEPVLGKGYIYFYKRVD